MGEAESRSKLTGNCAFTSAGTAEKGDKSRFAPTPDKSPRQPKPQIGKAEVFHGLPPGGSKLLSVFCLGVTLSFPGKH
jgi:hypothetical protein